jgi:hypothetical protein
MQHKARHEYRALHPSDEQISPEDIRQAVELILNSRHFSHAPMKRKFVQTICDYHLNNRAAELSEYLIGREVYERNERYSPSEDPVVRVAAHDVRKRLEQYYQNEGKEDPVRLEIPLGSYEPVFKQNLKNAEPAPSPASMEAGSQTSPPLVSIQPQEAKTHDKAERRRSLLWAGGILACCVLLIAASRFLPTVFLQLSEKLTSNARPQSAVWDPFLTSPNSTILVLSNPPVFSAINKSDPEVLRKNAMPLAPKQADELLKLTREKGPVPAGSYQIHLSAVGYTGVGEAIGVHKITDFFRIHGLGVNLKQSRTLSAEDLKDHNFVLLGSPMSNDWSGKLPVKEDFHFTQNATLANRSPRPGEQAEYGTRFDERSGNILEDYALVTVKPTTQHNGLMMILGGIRDVGTGAAAEYVTNKASIEELNRRIEQIGDGLNRPRYYQALLKVAVDNNLPTKISLLTVHEIKISAE